MSLGLLLTEKNFFLKKVQNWARPVHFFKSLSRIFLKILKLFNSSKLFFNLVENSILRNIKNGTFYLRPILRAVGDIFNGSGGGEGGCGVNMTETHHHKPIMMGIISIKFCSLNSMEVFSRLKK